MLLYLLFPENTLFSNTSRLYICWSLVRNILRLLLCPVSLFKAQLSVTSSRKSSLVWYSSVLLENPQCHCQYTILKPCVYFCLSHQTRRTRFFFKYIYGADPEETVKTKFDEGRKNMIHLYTHAHSSYFQECLVTKGS